LCTVIFLVAFRGQKSMMQSMALLLTWGFWMYCKYLDELVAHSLTDLAMELSSHLMTN